MNVLVINCGSSSIKADVIDVASEARIMSAEIERIGSADCRLCVDGGAPIELPNADHQHAMAALIPLLSVESFGIAAVGHRVVHGGNRFDSPVRLDDVTLEIIERLTPLAPLHNPANLAGIRSAMEALPAVAHIAVFDTAFHSTMPRRAKAYALPRSVVDKYNIRRYGFHGPSHQCVAQRAAAWLQEDVRNLRLITCHLGNGASVCAVEYGRSVETSMGMTPLEGLVMGTRSGDIDPGVIFALMRQEDLSIDEMDQMLNRASGLKGMSGVGNDLRDIESRAAEGDEACRLAIQVFAHRLRKYIGAYTAVMGGVDAIVFTGGIGENSSLMRHRVAQRLGYLGARLDEEKNRDLSLAEDVRVGEISTTHARTRILVAKTDEAMMIARAAAQMHIGEDRVEAELTIPIAISGRHIHLTDEAVAVLFGKGHQLTPYKPLSQPGQFACEERCTIVGPRNRIEKVRVLGPTRPKCQVEISRTDEFHLGIDAPVRNSGDVSNSPGVTLIGPQGSLTLAEGLICARRHIHMTPEDALRFGVKDRDVVEVTVDSQGRDLTFGDVLIRVKSSYALEMHVDTDEANAADIRSGHPGILSATCASASIRRRRLPL